MLMLLPSSIVSQVCDGSAKDSSLPGPPGRPHSEYQPPRTISFFCKSTALLCGGFMSADLCQGKAESFFILGTVSLMPGFLVDLRSSRLTENDAAYSWEEVSSSHP